MISSVALAALAATGASAGEPTRVVFCSERSTTEREATLLLAEWLVPAQVDLRSPQVCGRPRSGEFVVRFEQRGSRVLASVWPYAAEPLWRTVPWLTRLEAPLSRLAVEKRLSDFALLVQGAMAEHRLNQLAPAPRPRQPTRPAPTPAPAEAVSLPHAASSFEPKRILAFGGPPPIAALPPVAVPPPAIEQVHQSPPAPAAASPGLQVPLAAALSGGGHWRSPGVFAPELSVELSAGPFGLRTAVDSASSWNLSGRPFEVGAVGFAADYTVGLAEAGPARVDARLSALVERMTVRRLDRDATTHAYADLGAGVALLGSVRVVSGLRLGVGLEAGCFPTGRKVEIPGGPSMTLNRAFARTNLFLGLGDQ